MFVACLQVLAEINPIARDVIEVLKVAFTKEFIFRYVATTSLIAGMWFAPNDTQFKIEFVMSMISFFGAYVYELESMMLMILLAYIHGAIHIIYPFLDHNGRVPSVTPFWDVLCHFVMILQSNRVLGFSLRELQLLKYDYWHSIHINYYSLFWSSLIIIGVLNVLCSYFLTTQHEQWLDKLFDYSSLVQAISTAYFISGSLNNIHNSHSKLLIKYNWLFCMLFTTINWSVFKSNFYILGETAEHGYFQTLFIAPVCVGTLFCMINPVQKKQVQIKQHLLAYFKPDSKHHSKIETRSNKLSHLQQIIQ